MISHDEKISAEVLEVAFRLGESAVACRVENGNVVLEGPVSTDEHYYQIEQNVRALPGVRSVRNSMTVEGFGAEIANEVEGVDLTPDFTAETGAGDSFEAVSEAEPYTPPTDPVVTTTGQNADGVDVLNGFAETSDQGDNQSSLTVPRGDDELRESVEDALRLDAATTDLDIDVFVRDGTVTLRGTVPTLDDADLAESVAASVDGVEEVLEELRVEGM